MDRPGLMVISRRKWPPGIEAAIPQAIQSNRLNVSNGSVSKVMKFFIALESRCVMQFTIYNEFPIYNEKNRDRDPKTG
jgi:hypothetical protein